MPRKLRINQTVSKIKSITDYFADAVTAVDGVTSFKTALETGLPWADAAAEGVPFMKLAVKAIEELTRETDPLRLGQIACTIAFQNSALKAIESVGRPVAERYVISEIRKQLHSMDDVTMSDFSLDSPWTHEFFELAILNLRSAMYMVGYAASDIDKAVDMTKIEFLPSLMLILTEQKFEPFERYINLGGTRYAEIERRLLLHAGYQKWLFENSAVLGVLPFALSQVYVPADCGILEWEQIKEDLENPFDEKHGGRSNMLHEVLQIVKSPEYKDPILIQGSAGSGKSSFTLKLFDELIKDGFQPIRIRIRDIDFESNIDDAFGRAVRYTDNNYKIAEPPTLDGFFADKAFFNEPVSDRHSRISKYVLILDGWDELNVGDGSFREKIRYMLQSIKSEYISRNPLVRVILTGRPSNEIAETNLLSNKTKILTIRSLKPDVLRKYVKNLAVAVNTGRGHSEQLADEQIWRVPPLSEFEPILASYTKSFQLMHGQVSQDDDLEEDNQSEQVEQKANKSLLDVLASPLLAFLSVRLISAWIAETKSNPMQLVRNPTVLYRNLIDLTTGKAGKYDDQIEDESSNQNKLYGTQLRGYLHRIAAAITIRGQESISEKELAIRLRQSTKQLEDQAADLEGRNKLSKLLISFFFRSAEHLGCEFQHKSFREYLYAEGIVEAIKAYGRNQMATGPFRNRNHYWEDFERDTVIFDFSRELCELFASKPLTTEILKYVDRLLSWEIERSQSPQNKGIGSTTRAISWEEWIAARNGLCALWEWWYDAAFLRPQFIPGRRAFEPSVEPPYSHELSLILGPVIDNQPKIFENSQQLDSAIGENLFNLNSLVHGYMFHFSNKEFQSGDPSSKFQSNSVKSRVVSFRPGVTPTMFQTIAFRINANYGYGAFPAGQNMNYIDLGAVNLDSLNFSDVSLKDASLREASLRYTNFNRAELSTTQFTDSKFSYTSLHDAHISTNNISHTDAKVSLFDSLFLDGEWFDRVTAIRLLWDREQFGPVKHK
jgi:hypothetical protein